MPSDLSVNDFASALRQMADNADRVADRHDVAEMDQLHVKIGILTARAQRDGDLIAELRRQAVSMGRSLDGIGKMLRTVSGDDVKILADALLLISEDRCANFTGSWSCRSDGSGKSRRGPYGTSALWCDPCVARDALERAGWTDAD
jgi:hypothetical protein